MPKSQPECCPVAVCTTIHNIVLFVQVHLQMMLIDSLPSLDMPHTPPPPSQHPQSPPNHTYPNNHSHSHQSAETLITDAPAHERAVSSAMYASSTMDHILNMLARPLKWGSSSLGIDNWGACTPLRPLALECELRNHPDKAFIQLLLTDIRQGCNIGYTGPHFTYAANNLQSALSNPSVLDDALQSECKQCRILGPFNAPSCRAQV